MCQEITIQNEIIEDIADIMDTADQRLVRNIRNTQKISKTSSSCGNVFAFQKLLFDSTLKFWTNFDSVSHSFCSKFQPACIWLNSFAPNPPETPRMFDDFAISLISACAMPTDSHNSTFSNEFHLNRFRTFGKLFNWSPHKHHRHLKPSHLLVLRMFRPVDVNCSPSHCWYNHTDHSR